MVHPENVQFLSIVSLHPFIKTPAFYAFDNCQKKIKQLSKMISTIVKRNFDNCRKHKTKGFLMNRCKEAMDKTTHLSDEP
jgi:hypothetical protein